MPVSPCVEAMLTIDPDPRALEALSLMRPKKLPDLRKLVLKIGRETGWGYTRVLGEIKKLTSQKISRQSVANILREAGLDPPDFEYDDKLLAGGRNWKPVEVECYAV